MSGNPFTVKDFGADFKICRCVFLSQRLNDANDQIQKASGVFLIKKRRAFRTKIVSASWFNFMCNVYKVTQRFVSI